VPQLYTQYNIKLLLNRFQVHNENYRYLKIQLIKKSVSFLIDKNIFSDIKQMKMSILTTKYITF